MVEVLMNCGWHTSKVVHKSRVLDKNRQGASYGKH